MGDARVTSIETRIHDAYDTLPKSERKLADVILDSPGDLSAYTATELTALAGVSKAAGTRLFRRLGFSSYDEARVLAREAANWGSPLYTERKANRRNTNLTDYLEDEMRNLKATLHALNPQQLNSAVEEIVGARRVYLMGYRNSHYLAGYMRWQIIQFRGDVHMLPPPGETIAEYLGDFMKGDLLIVFALRRRVAGLGKVLAQAREQGASVLLITDPTARGLPAHADWTFICEVETPYVFDSCSGAISLARYLSIEALHKAGKRGRVHLERIERHHEHLEEFE